MLTHEEMMARGSQKREGAATIERLDSRLLTGDPWYIFNIYSSEHQVNLGTAGQYYIPPCPEGKEWVRSPTVIPGTVEDIYPHFNDKEEYRVTARIGEDVMKCALGYGAGQSKEEDLRRFGIFASRNSSPSKAELLEAKKRLVPELQKQIATADKLASSADTLDRQSVYDDKFFRAARYLNVKKPWLSEAAEMTQCPFCSIAVSPSASICHGCNQIINQAAFDATKKQLQGGV